MIRPEHPFDIRPDLRKAESTTVESVIRPKQLVRPLARLHWPFKWGGLLFSVDYSAFESIWDSIYV
jgi:hypothetical protein